jgi:hypothetical protein
MPFSYRIEPEINLLLIYGEGVITQVERVEAIHAWLNDPNFRPGMDTLCDLSKAASVPSWSELGEIVAIVKRRLPSIGSKKVAIVSVRSLVFGVARQFQGLLEATPLDVRVFRNREAAMAWLQGEKAHSSASDERLKSRV